MNTTPSIDDLVAAVIQSIGDDLLPHLGNAKAQATAIMAQSVLQGVRQLLEVYDENIALDHNEMTAGLRNAAAALDGVEGEAADRIRDRAATLGSQPDLPPPPDRSAIASGHCELGRAMEASLIDVDELQRAGVGAADGALNALREAMTARYLRDVAAITVGEGFIGRG